MLKSRNGMVFALLGLLAGTLALLVVGGCAAPDQSDADQSGAQAPSGSRNEAKSETARNVRVLELQRRSLEEFIEIAGAMAPVRGADISAEESGAVIELVKAKGDAVKAGDGLLEQDRVLLKAEMEAAASSLELQAYNLDKTRQLFEAGKISRIELLEAEAAAAGARAQAQVTAERFGRALVKAPFDGILADRFVELGEMVQPGQVVARVIDPYILKLEGHVTASQVAHALVGSPAVVALGAGEVQARGTIAWVAPEADRMTGKFKIEVQVPNPELQLRSGIIGRALISKDITRDVVSVPRDAIMEGRHGLEVFVVEGDRAYRRGITSGPDQGVMVVVTEGLKPGDKLVVRGHRELVEGALVRITQEATDADGAMASDPGVVQSAGGLGTEGVR